VEQPASVRSVTGSSTIASIRLPSNALVVLVGPSGSGKSTWAARWFRPDQVVSTDRVRELVGMGEHDQRAGTDAFDVLDMVLDRRLRRGLLTVVDSLGLEAARRRAWLAAADRHGRPCHVVMFEVVDREARRRNRERDRPVPAKILTGQLRRFATVGEELAAENYDGVHSAGPAVVVPPVFAFSPHWKALQEEDPVSLRFGLQIPVFDWSGGNELMREQLSAVAGQAEEAGFSSLWLMDHMLQIPAMGRAWDPILESYTTLGFLAARTSSVRLGTMVTGITYRNIGHLGKIVATLDVLSGGRAVCGIGLAWFEREHKAYGWPFPPRRERYELLEDALRFLPLMWGPGSPSFTGHRFAAAEAVCYPRPLQEHVPILVGGSGERRTLRLVARYADACNLFGEPEVVRHKVEVLRRHCEEAERDPAEVTVTQLSTVMCGLDDDDVARRVDALRGDEPPESWAARAKAGTVDDHVGRFRALAAAGVQEAVVSLADLGQPGAVERFASVIDAFGQK
jgi:F420-dependent oxidoreductase-like protein